uniref:Uncharacterized protein n=1 Tax=Aegilops tauschii TaxID=37682 RepID=N1QUY4_AEGTA
MEFTGDDVVKDVDEGAVVEDVDEGAARAAPAPAGPEDDADGTAAVTPSDEIEEHDPEITDDADEEEEDDDGFCVVQGITIALEFSDGEEDWIVV